LALLLLLFAALMFVKVSILLAAIVGLETKVSVIHERIYRN